MRSLTRGLSGPLASRNFRFLVSCDVISVAGSSVSLVVLPFAVLGIGGSAVDVGLVATAQLVPLTCALLIGGVVADRLPRHQVIVAADVLQALAQSAASGLVLTGHASVWQLAALAAVGGLALGFHYPASQGLLPQTVPADQRQQANAIDRTGRNAAKIGGSALGGLLAAGKGVPSRQLICQLARCQNSNQSRWSRPLRPEDEDAVAQAASAEDAADLADRQGVQFRTELRPTAMSARRHARRRIVPGRRRSANRAE